MASLSNPHWEAIAASLRDLLTFIGEHTFAERFYLAGGTALALRLGHRRSYDLDFFSETDEVLTDTRKEILAALAERQPQTLENVDGNLWANSGLGTKNQTNEQRQNRRPWRKVTGTFFVDMRLM